MEVTMDVVSYKQVLSSAGISILSMRVSEGAQRLVFPTLECWVTSKDESVQSKLVKVFSSEDEMWSCISLFEDPECITEDELQMFIMLKPKMYTKIRDAYQYENQYLPVKIYPTNR